MRIRKAVAAVLAGALVLTTFATGTTSEAAKKTKLKTKKVSIFVKGKKKISITGKKAKHKYTFTSKKKKIAKVSKKGVITGVKAGKTTITVKDTWKQKGKKKTKKLGTVKVTVKKKVPVAPKVTPSVQTPVVPPAQTADTQASATPVPTGEAQTSATPVPTATPSSTPKVTKKPTATPTAAPTVTPKAPKAEITLEKENINAGKTTTAEVSVNKGTVTDVVWKTADEKTATVQKDSADAKKAEITGVAKGETKVIAEVKVKVENTDFTVTVESALLKVADSDALVVNASVESAPTEMTVGDEFALKVTVDTGTIESIDWAVSGDAIVVAETESGDVLKAVKAGEVTVTGTVTVKQGDKTATDTVQFTVYVMEKYNIQDAANFWCQNADIKYNDDGTLTYTKQQGEQDWQAGEFGFVVPREMVGKFTKVIIKYKDATLNPPESEKGCGYVFHYDDEKQVSWIEGEDHWDDALRIYGDGEIVLENKDPDRALSTVRIYDGVLNGQVTIVSVTYQM
ncbi:MAG: hypothetical protein HFG34_07160 [Eubacterium sp.]|nr:hypothetical protein [Eubacterium sp.]